MMMMVCNRVDCLNHVLLLQTTKPVAQFLSEATIASQVLFSSSAYYGLYCTSRLIIIALFVRPTNLIAALCSSSAAAVEGTK